MIEFIYYAIMVFVALLFGGAIVLTLIMAYGYHGIEQRRRKERAEE